jgi:aspartate-semialdehyde dehydrogenase
MQKLRVGILGATGQVGQKFISLLEGHPWFNVVAVAASPNSKGKSYIDAVSGRWAQENTIPNLVQSLIVSSVFDDVDSIVAEVDFVFSAVDTDKTEIQRIEELYASKGIPVVSNNSAHRWTKDVPMIIPEVNPDHTDMIDIQRKNRGWDRGFIVVKPNCSIQSYVPPLTALAKFGVEQVMVSTYQAISGAGKTFETWPEMVDNVIPYIGGEEQKSEDEPRKIWSHIVKDEFKLPTSPIISAHCIRVPVSNGHMATVSVKLRDTISQKQILETWNAFQSNITYADLPSSPSQMMTYYKEDIFPQTKMHRNVGNGMGVTLGRLRPCNVFDWKFVSLSHNTVRGAAGGAILLAELCKAKGYL